MIRCGRFMVCFAGSLAGLLLGSAVVAAEIYRWVDADGTVTFSNVQRPGAERLKIEPAPAVDLALPAQSVGEDEQGIQPAVASPDYRLSITNLEDGEIVWNDARVLELELGVTPPLAVDEGHRLQVFVDGQRRAVLGHETRVRLLDIDRGTHRVWAEIVASDGRRLATSERLTIHHRQHSIGRGSAQPRGS